MHSAENSASGCGDRCQVVVVAVVIEQQLNRTAAVGSKPAVSAADFLFAEMLQKCQRCPAGFGQTVHGHQAKAAVEQGRLRSGRSSIKSESVQ